MAPQPIQVYGVRETLRDLGQIEPTLRKESVRSIRAAAEPLRAGVAAKIPTTPPLSGWAHKGRTGYTRASTRVVTKYGGRSRRDRDTWPLVSITIKGTAGSMFDMAGRRSAGNTEQGMAFVAGLNAAGGTASRAAWPTAERMLPQIQASVLAAIKATSAQMNRNLVQRPAGI